LTFRVEIDGQEYSLDVERNGSHSEYRLLGLINTSGTASLAEVMPGVFSVLLENRNFTVHLVPNGDNVEVWTNGQRHMISIADTRDRSRKNKNLGPSGPMEVRAQMPGRVIKLLVQPGEAVEAGQGLIVVEAMKMQNEMKAPKRGSISKIRAVEGATVAAGEPLVVVE